MVGIGSICIYLGKAINKIDAVESGIFGTWHCLLEKTSESIMMDWLSSSKMCFPGWVIEFSPLVTALSEWLSEAGLSWMKP